MLFLCLEFSLYKGFYPFIKPTPHHGATAWVTFTKGQSGAFQGFQSLLASPPFTVIRFPPTERSRDLGTGTKQNLVGVAKKQLSTFSSTHLYQISPSSLLGPTCCLLLSQRAPRDLASPPPSTRPPDYPFLRRLRPRPPPPPPACLPPLGGPYGTVPPSSDPHATPDKPRFSTFNSLPLTSHSFLKCCGSAEGSRWPVRPRCCVSLSAGSAACTAWKVTWRWDRPAPPHSCSPHSRTLPSPLTSTKSNMSSSVRPNRSRFRDSNGLTGPSPNR